MESPYDHPELASSLFRSTIREGGGLLPMQVPVLDSDGEPMIVTGVYKLTGYETDADFQRLGHAAMMRVLVRVAVETHKSAIKGGALPR